MKSIRFTVATLSLAALTYACTTWASSFSNDQSDLWWNSGENGWGIQFVQRGSTIFATMFVYDSSGNPVWYVATMQGANPNGVLTFAGDLFSVHGSWFGAVPYDPVQVGGVKVGPMTWQQQNGVAGTLTYSVNGVNVTKSLTRQPIGSDDYSGLYLVGIHLVASGCSNPAENGTTDGSSALAITQVDTAIGLTLVALGCTLAGTYSQKGQFGTASGTYSCATGDTGTFELTNMNVTPYAMTGLVSTSSTGSGCQSVGQIGGVRADR